MVKSAPRLSSLAAILMLLTTPILPLGAAAAAESLTRAEILSSDRRSGPEAAAIQMLIEEAAKRAPVRWRESHRYRPGENGTILIARASQIAPMLPEALRHRWQADRRDDDARPEGYNIDTYEQAGHPILVVAGNDARGVLFGAGALLRMLTLSPEGASLPEPLRIRAAPQVAVRSHQIGYRAKNNSYDGWTLPMFEQQIRDLAIFGANGLQLIAPVSDDDAASPLFPAPAEETLIGISRLLDKYGLNCDLYYPELAKDYSDPAAVAAELSVFEALVRRFPRLDAVYIPGGDPGHTDPAQLFPLAEQEARILRKYHPHAAVWISGQGFDQARFERFYAYLARRPLWLTGVFFGPQSRDSFETERTRIPPSIPMLFYPDIGHILHAQFPVPHLDPAFGLLEGREPIDPRPHAEAAIFRHFAPFNNGFVTYSEGVNDDVNKMIWSRLGWDADQDVGGLLREYARFVLGARIGADSSDRFAEGLQALEDDWTGPAADNENIDHTLALFDRLDAAASPTQRTNWRFEEALYRADYDAYVRARSRAEAARETQAMVALAEAPRTGSEQAILAAQTALAVRDDDAITMLRGRLFELAGRLFDHARLQLSVRLYGASTVERGANLDRVDVSLNNKVWLSRQFSEISSLPSEPEKLARIKDILQWRTPAPGTFHDDLGDPDQEPHLVRGAGVESDPEFYHSAIDGIADRTPDDGWRMSWITYAETLYEQPLELVYHGLDPTRRYRVKVVYAGEDYWKPISLRANGEIEIHPLMDRPANPTIKEFALPMAATQSGDLTLSWECQPGQGGSGRGHQVAEVWLSPEDRN